VHGPTRRLTHPLLRSTSTPFDRDAETRPLLRVIVELDEILPEDDAAAARVLALAELPFLDVRGRRSSERLGVSDLRVVSRPTSDVVSSHGAVSPLVALDLVRLLLVNRGMYYLRGGSTVNEGFYYLYRVKSVFRAYQPAWSAAVFGSSALGADVRDQLSSLGKRLCFLCRAADRGSHAALQRANNDTEDNALYHLAYFVMLATGVFDDLAWTLTYLYRLSLSRIQVVLKVNASRSSSPFLDALRAAAPSVAARVADPHLQNLLRVFYPIRDSLQHRQFLRGLLYVGGPWGVPKILFEFPTDAVQPIRDASTDGSGTDWGLGRAGESYVDPYAFLSRAFSAVATVHEAILETPDWLAMVGQPGDPSRDELDRDLAPYRASLARFLRLPADPLYF
jgi:hypothetical protein